MVPPNGTFRTRCASLASRPAFTLVELVLVMAILGILTAMAVPRYAGVIARQQSEAVVRRIITDLAFAQRNARACGAERIVRFDSTNHLYVLITETTKSLGPPCDQSKWGEWATACSPNTATGESYNCQVYLSNLPYEAKVVTVNFGGDAEIAFDGFGTPDSGGSVTIGVGAYSKTVSINATTGKASAL